MDRRFAKRAFGAASGFPEAARIVGQARRDDPPLVSGPCVASTSGKPATDKPLIHIDGDRNRLPLSFLNLIELRFLAGYREGLLPCLAIRAALDYAARELEVDRPLLEMEFQVHGREAVSALR